MRRFLICCLMVFLAGAASPAFALNGLFLAKGPLGYATKEDIKIAIDSIRSALDTGADGVTYSWNNPKTNASGTTLLNKTFTKRGMRCRNATLSAEAKDRTGKQTVDLCKTTKGWKVVS